MKKIFAIMTAMVVFTVTMFADNDKVITFTQLPEKAQTFITTNFPGEEVVLAKVDKGIMETEYDVVMAGGAKIEFDGDGTMKEIESKRSPLKAEFIPQAARAAIEKSFPSAVYEKFSWKRYGCEVELTDGREIKLNKDYVIIDIDY